MSLYIYGTVFNNADRVEACLASLEPLQPYQMYLVDNFSTDGTYDILKKYPQIHIERKKCKKGAGRGRALSMVMEKAKPDDIAMYVDLDCVYKQPFIEYVKNAMKSCGENEVRCVNYIYAISKVSTNKNFPWHDLQAGEDWERSARMLANGVHMTNVMNTDGRYYENAKFGDSLQSSREKRYSQGSAQLYHRVFTWLVDNQRGEAYKSFKDFYEAQPNKSPSTWLVHRLAYHMGNLMGVYSYDKKMNNKEYVQSIVG